MIRLLKKYQEKKNCCMRADYSLGIILSVVYFLPLYKMNVPLIAGIVVALILIIVVVVAMVMMNKEPETEPEAGDDVIETKLNEVAQKLPARFIRIEKVEPSTGLTGAAAQNINLMEVYATDAAGSSVLSGATVTGSSSALNNYPYTNLIDGNESTLAHNNPTATATNEWLEIALATDANIKKIEVVARPSYLNRSIGLRISVLDSTRNQIFASEIIRTAQPRYVYDI
jgi:Ca2+/Na+ antiporter